MGDDKCMQNFSGQAWREENTWEDLDIDGKILKGNNVCGMNWIYLSWDTNRWRAVVDKILKRWIL